MRPHRLEYLPLDQQLAVVRLVAGLPRDAWRPGAPALVLGTPQAIVRAPALGSVTHQPSRLRRTADQLLWRVTFAAPLELVECPQALFGLVADGLLPTRLPDPRLADLAALCEPWDVGTLLGAFMHAVAWRRATALGTAVAVAGSSVVPPAVALASSGSMKMHHPVIHHRALCSVPTPIHTCPLPGSPASPSQSSAPHHSTPSPHHSTSSAGGSQSRASTSSTGGSSKAAGSARQARHHTHAVADTVQGGLSAGPGRPVKRPHHSSTGGSSAPGAPASPTTGPTSQPTSTTTSTQSPTPGAAHGHRHRHHHSTPPRHHGDGSGLSSLSPTPPDGLVSSTTGSPGVHRAGHHPAHHHGGLPGQQHHHGGVAGQQHHHGGVPGQQHHHHGSHHDGVAGAHPRHSSSGGTGLSTLTPSPPVHLHKAHHKHTTPTGGSGVRQAQPESSPTSSETAPTNSFWTTGMGIGPAEVALMSHLSGLFGKVNQPPPFLIPIYKRAGARFHVPWQVLAAINSIETDYGRNLNISSAGAEGWMQFMPSTWAEYGMSVNGHGPPNPYDPTDAIFSAARYLAANGGGKHLRQAIFAYNHATWYVDDVLWRAGMISDHVRGVHHLGAYSLPLDVRYMHVLGRTDDGVDIETAPDGAAVYSMTPGVVTAVASNPGGFGPNYPVIRVTHGPLLGQYIYYGHVAASLVKVGQHVLAGQPIAVIGHTGDAASLGHGHIEIGFSDGYGDPINHHGAMAWTPSGAAMRRVLVALAAGFHIKTS